MLKKLKLKYSSKVKYDFGPIKIEEKHNQFLIEKIIGVVEKNTLNAISMEKPLKLCLKLKRTIGYLDVSTNPCLVTLKTPLFSIYIRLNLTISNNGWG